MDGEEGGSMLKQERRRSVIDEFADRRPSKFKDRVKDIGNARQAKCKLETENLLLVLTVVAVVFGVGLGLVLRVATPHLRDEDRNLMYLKFPGELFLRMMKMIILPLVVSSLISSLASLEASTAGKLGLYAMMYYFSTTFLAVVLGVILSLTIRPGEWSKASYDIEESDNEGKCISQAVDTILDLMRNLFPDNLIEGAFRTVKTCSEYYRRSNVTNTSLTKVPNKEAMNMNPEDRSELVEKPATKDNDGMNILGLVMFSIVFGFIISRMEEEGKPLLHFFHSLEGGMMRLIALVIWYAPFGITFLIAAQIVEVQDPKTELKRLAGYMITVLTGLLIHGLIVLPTMLFAFTRRNPITYAYGMLQALLTALGTSSRNYMLTVLSGPLIHDLIVLPSMLFAFNRRNPMKYAYGMFQAVLIANGNFSSSAALPLSIKCLEENNGIDPRVTRFMLPLGATINMDGTALYEAVAVIYIAQTLGAQMTTGKVILVSLTATLASIGAAGIPQAGIITMIMVLMAVGLPTRYFVLIMPVDWFLDRIRTTINVHGDSVGAGIVAKLCQHQLDAATANRYESVPLNQVTPAENYRAGEEY